MKDIYGNTILGAFQLNNQFIGKIINGATANCSINLPSISITVDGKEVFTGAKEVYYAMEK
jgi:hypothetical protein